MIVITLALIAGAACAWYVRTASPENPANKLFVSCAFHTITGWKCAGCGTTRAIHHLLNGRFTAAFRVNPLLFTLTPAVALIATSDLLLRRRGRTLHPSWVYAVLISVAAAMFARNLLGF